MPVIPMDIGIFRHLITTSRQLKQDSLSRKTGAKDNVSFFVDSVVQKAILCRSSLANGLLKTNIKVRLEYELKFSNLGGIFVEGYFLLFDCHTFKNML